MPISITYLLQVTRKKDDKVLLRRVRAHGGQQDVAVLSTTGRPRPFLCQSSVTPQPPQVNQVLVVLHQYSPKCASCHPFLLPCPQASDQKPSNLSDTGPAFSSTKKVTICKKIDQHFSGHISAQE